MGTVLNLVQEARPVIGLPMDLFKLRWRFRVGLIQVSGPWTPSVEKPSLTETLARFEGKISHVYIDGIHRFNGDKVVFMDAPYEAMAKLEYKGFANSQGSVVGGIEMQDVEGRVYLVLRDGNVNVFDPKGSAHVANDH